MFYQLKVYCFSKKKYDSIHHSIVFVPTLRGHGVRRFSFDGQPKYQSSLSTVFSIWNTMIGSTLVALPYGFSTSGLFLGLGIVISMGSICCYTCNLIVRHGKVNVIPILILM